MEKQVFIRLFQADKLTDLHTAYLCALIISISIHDDIV